MWAGAGRSIFGRFLYTFYIIHTHKSDHLWVRNIAIAREQSDTPIMDIHSLSLFVI